MWLWDKPVSTHAPAQGATAYNVDYDEIDNVSTHAPAQGATFFGLSVADLALVSTHAPAQGATKRDSGKLARCYGFNPRARTGRDLELGVRWANQVMFQPTRPHRARQRQPCSRPPSRFCFNPRARTGRDVAPPPNQRPLLKVSTHAPAQGATAAAWIDQAAAVVSTHAPAQGATALTRRPSPVLPSFQPTRPHRARRDVLREPDDEAGVSTHAPAQGATCCLPCGGAQKRFQPTRPHRARHDVS